MKNAPGVLLGASGRGGYAGPAVVEDMALGESTPSAGATRGMGGFETKAFPVCRSF